MLLFVHNYSTAAVKPVVLLPGNGGALADPLIQQYYIDPILRKINHPSSVKYSRKIKLHVVF